MAEKFYWHLTPHNCKGQLWDKFNGKGIGGVGNQSWRKTGGNSNDRNSTITGRFFCFCHPNASVSLAKYIYRIISMYLDWILKGSWRCHLLALSIYCS